MVFYWMSSATDGELRPKIVLRAILVALWSLKTCSRSELRHVILTIICIYFSSHSDQNQNLVLGLMASSCLVHVGALIPAILGHVQANFTQMKVAGGIQIVGGMQISTFGAAFSS